MSKRIVEISPSVLGADLMRLGEEIKMAEREKIPNRKVKRSK